uniref:Choline/carnitine acyltransferase domain-containing protein n=1 Tax=Ditylenchus dipsaci TaxID=166011 RepID=A0A915D176_9BILA
MARSAKDDVHVHLEEIPSGQMGLIKEKASSHPSTNVSMDVKKVKSQRTKALNPPFPLHHAYYPSTFARWRIDFIKMTLEMVFLFNNIIPASTSALYFYYSRTNPSSSILRLVSSVPLLRSLNTTSQTVITSLLTAYMPVLSLRTFLKWFVFNYKGYVLKHPKTFFDHQNLGCLTCASLKKTVQGYLESVQPVLPKNEFDQLQQMADQFLSNEGKKLQRYTLFYSMFTTNYVTYLWEKYETVWNTRIPGKYCDQWRPIRYSRHVAVYLDGCFYRVDLFDECNRLYSLDELADIFTELLCRRETASTAEQKLAALTHDKRNIWHNNRNQFFLKNSVNSQSLEVIESAIVFLILDQADHYDFNLQKPAVMDNFAREMLAGNGKNRWVDKSLNFVVSKNGRIGGTSEHSVGDGSEFDHVMENFLYIDANFLEYPKSVVDIDTLVDFKPEHQHVKLAERLRFEIDERLKSTDPSVTTNPSKKT